MGYLIIAILNWVYLPDHISADLQWWWIAPAISQVFLQLWLFQKTWVEYGFVMRAKMVLDKMPLKIRWLAKAIALDAVIDDVCFRITWGPILFFGSVSPIPKNKHDWLMTGLLHRIKSTYPTDSWQWIRANWFCSSWLDAMDVDGDHC